jgi:hypothetical protein
MSSTYETVKVEHENGIAWVILNRPDKRNAMSPQLHYDMCEVLDELEQVPGRKDLSARHPALQPALRESIVAEAEAVMRHLATVAALASCASSTT